MTFLSSDASLFLTLIPDVTETYRSVALVSPNLPSETIVDLVGDIRKSKPTKPVPPVHDIIHNVGGPT